MPWGEFKKRASEFERRIQGRTRTVAPVVSECDLCPACGRAANDPAVWPEGSWCQHSFHARFNRHEVVATECDLYGHDYLIIDAEEPGPRRPERVGCARCDQVWYVGGKSWRVER